MKKYLSELPHSSEDISALITTVADHMNGVTRIDSMDSLQISFTNHDVETVILSLRKSSFYEIE